MKKIAFAAIAAAMFAACDNAPKFHVEGTIQNAADSTIVLEAAALDGIKTLKTAKLGADGHFQFSADAPANPEFYRLRIADNVINFSIDSTETLRFSASLPGMASNYQVSGSDNAQKIREIALAQQKLQRQVIDIERNQSLLPGDAADSIRALVEKYKENIKQKYIFQEPHKAYAYYAVCQSIADLAGTYQLFNPLTDRTDVKCYATVATAWDANWPDAERTIQICNTAIKGMENTAPPRQQQIQVDESKIHETGIINVELPDIEGNIRALSQLKGSVVMLDFTLYGAKQSAQRTRLMRQLYDKYHAQGFEIYQVSLDDDTHFWKFSCEKLPWICVHETDGTATSLYAVSSLPTFFIINRNNEIVKRSELVEDLEAEIKALL